MSEEKKVWEERKQALFLEKKNGYDLVDDATVAAMTDYCEGYKRFLDAAKTEREAVTAAIALAEEQGFVPFVRGMALKAGDKVYRNNRGKGLMLAVIGEASLAEGVQIGAAHIDSPRLDLKPYPLYEDSDFALLKTHYYGGIRKYQWLSVPLELHGVVIRKDGTSVQVKIGGEPGDPVLAIPDLLPHLAAQQSQKSLGTAIDPENLNIFVGTRPFPGSEGDNRVKLAILDLLNQKYGIVEEDFLSAELSAVPAYTAGDVGLDRSMIGAYGQDDRVCAYASLKGLFDAEQHHKTAVCVLADKEEIGSDGVSGMQSQVFDTFISDLCDTQGVALKTCLEHSFCLSSDVTACYDPNYAEVYDKRNSSLINRGVGLCKYTGSRGKGGASDASAEVMGYIRSVLDKAGVLWHVAELGKVDVGGGGTVALFMANRNIDTVDAGVSVLGMHAPYEVTSKLDCYMTYRGMKAVFEQ
jgi:aspartyl aminopeptidase